MKSIYKSFEKSAKLVLDNAKNSDIKLLLRHSIRYSMPVSQNASEDVAFETKLTTEGKDLAEFFGRGFKSPLDSKYFSINRIYTSPSPRCVQSSEHLLKGYGKKADIIESDMLKGFWIQDWDKWAKSFLNANKDIKKLLQDMLDRKEVSGAYPIDVSIARILNFLQLDSNNITSLESSLTLYFTHDAIIMLLLAYILKCDIYTLYKYCVRMLEGVFFWRENNDIYLAYRGEIHKIDSKILDIK